MLHNWDGLLVCGHWVGLVYVDSQVNRLLVLVATLPFDNLNLVFETQNRAATMTLGVAGGIHSSVLSIDLIVTIPIFIQHSGCLLVLRVNQCPHIYLGLSADVAELFGDWVGLDLVMRSAGGISLSANDFGLLFSEGILLVSIAQELAAVSTFDISIHLFSVVVNFVFVCLA